MRGLRAWEMPMQRSFEEIAPLRFGFGRGPGDAPAPTPETLLAQVPQGAAEKPSFAEEGSAERIGRLDALWRQLRKARADKDRQATMAAAQRRSNYQQDAFLQDAHARTMGSVGQPLGFYERLACFWSDHFTVSAAKRSIRALVGPFEAEAIRPNVAGDFATLLRQASLHPTMLFYLDQNRSVGPNSAAAKGKRGLNENLAREIIELHTLGVEADYTQQDVRQFAELLTGVTVDTRRGSQAFEEASAEPGAEEVLGRSYGGDPADFAAVLQALDDLARHPATARHIARKLAVHFLADEPPEEVVRHLEAAYRENDTQLMPVYRALLEHPASWQTFGQKVRQPYDWVVAGLRLCQTTEAGRTLPLTPDDRRRMGGGMADDGGKKKIAMPQNWPWTLRPLGQLGQLPWTAPGPDGWPEEAAAWITPQGLAERIDFASRLAKVPLDRVQPETLMREALGPNGSDRLALLALEARGPREANALILLSPELQRR